MAELRVQLTGEDVRKLVSGDVTKISINHIVFAVGKTYMQDVDTIVVGIVPDVSLPILKHYVEEAEKKEKRDEEATPRSSSS